MLSYRHLFHAGNFADVFKHALLTRLLTAMSAKDKPYCYIDTHAGIGRYDLTHPWAQKAREYENGIARVWKAKDVPAALEPYVDAVRALNPHGNLRFYPGSPLIARRFMRAADRMVLVELNKIDYQELEAVFAREKRVAVQLMDAYQALKAYLPPAERRGLVLIDSSFDRARELDRIVKALKEAYGRWPTGMYAEKGNTGQTGQTRVFIVWGLSPGLSPISLKSSACSRESAGCPSQPIVSNTARAARRICGRARLGPVPRSEESRDGRRRRSGRARSTLPMAHFRAGGIIACTDAR